MSAVDAALAADGGGWVAAHGSEADQYPGDHRVDRPIADCSNAVACCWP